MLSEIMQMQGKFGDVVRNSAGPMAGFNNAAMHLSPMLMSMARGLREGRGASAYAGQGLAMSQMMAEQREAKAEQEAQATKLKEMLPTLGLTPQQAAYAEALPTGQAYSYLGQFMGPKVSGGGGRLTQAEINRGLDSQADATFASMLGGGMPSQEMPSTPDGPQWSMGTPVTEAPTAQPQMSMGQPQAPQTPDLQAAQQRAIALYQRAATTGDTRLMQRAEDYFNTINKMAESIQPPEPELSEREARIQRIQQVHGVDEQTASAIVDGILQTSRDPLTGELQVVNMLDMANPQTPPQPTPQPQQVTPEAPAQEALSFGNQFSNADSGFGAGSVVRGAANTIGDTLGMGMPFPETENARNDFRVFGEGLVNAFSSAYGRQPPSWLLKNIADLTPREGSILEGPGRAQSKLQSLDRELETRKRGLQRSLQRRMDPNARSDVEGQIAGIDATLQQIRAALGGFGGGVEIRPEVADRLKAYQ